MADASRTPVIVVVDSIATVAPFMRRITVRGSGLDAFAVGAPARWIKVFVPSPSGEGPPGRAYTIRRCLTDPVRIELDFVIHAGGLCSSWAIDAKVGDCLQIAGPRAGYIPKSQTRHLILGGDETALPAIAAILESWPAEWQADVFVEFPDGDAPTALLPARDGGVTWISRRGAHAGTSRLLADAVLSSRVVAGETELWFSAEAEAVKTVRAAYRGSTHSPGMLTAVAYWRRGDRDHKDRDT